MRFAGPADLSHAIPRRTVLPRSLRSFLCLLGCEDLRFGFRLRTLVVENWREVVLGSRAVSWLGFRVGCLCVRASRVVSEKFLGYFLGVSHWICVLGNYSVFLHSFSVFFSFLRVLFFRFGIHLKFFCNFWPFILSFRTRPKKRDSDSVPFGNSPSRDRLFFNLYSNLHFFNILNIYLSG